MNGEGASEDLRAEIKGMSELLARIITKKLASPKGEIYISS